MVRKTGGLADTVRDVESHQNGEGNGYTFEGSDEGSLYRWGTARQTLGTRNTPRTQSLLSQPKSCNDM